MNDLPLGTFVTYNPSSVGPDTPIEKAESLMQRYGARHLPVVDQRKAVVGIVSNHDVATARTRRAQLVSATGNEGVNCENDILRIHEIMTRDVLTIDQNDTPRQALDVLLQRHVHCLPVVDERRLVGMLTSTDFLRNLSYGEMACGRDPVRKHMTGIQAQVDDDATLDEAWRIFRETGCDYLAAVKGECPVGVVSRRALRLAMRGEPAGLGREDLREESPATIAPLVDTSAPEVRPHASLVQAVNKMLQSQVPVIPVVNRTNAFVGLLTEDDVLRAMLEDFQS